MAVEPVDLRVIDERSANIYEAIIVSAKKARKINDENKIEYNALLSTIPTSGTEDENEDIENPAQLKIALEVEKKEKPHLEALEQLLEGKINYEYRNK